MTSQLLLQFTAIILLGCCCCSANKMNDDQVAKLLRFLKSGRDIKDDWRWDAAKKVQDFARIGDKKVLPNAKNVLVTNDDILKPKLGTDDNAVSLPQMENPTEKTRSSSRQHKAFFVNYPVMQRIFKDKDTKPSTGRKKQKQKQKHKVKQESDIFFIRLPPSPYSYIPGLGYISQPPSFSPSSLPLTGNNVRKKPKPKPKDPFIKVPIDFVSNGKPTSVYRYPTNKNRPRDSPIIRLNRGPYIFDGKPSSLYVVKKNKPKGTL